MTTYEITNTQRAYFGLDPIPNHWERVFFKGDKYRPDSFLYFDGDTIKRHIISTENEYLEFQCDELTRERVWLLPKKKSTAKEKKLSPAVLEERQPKGVYLSVSQQGLIIANFHTQTSFYESRWHNETPITKSIREQISEFVEQSSEEHVEEITAFKNAKRKRVKYASGDYFCFRLDRTHFGFGRLLLDVNIVRKKGLITKEHRFSLFMGKPIIFELFAYKSTTKNVDLSLLDTQPKLPSDVMMDNLLFYGEYEIIGHRDLSDEEFDFPISYETRYEGEKRFVFLQWGLIQVEMPKEKFDASVMLDTTKVIPNLYGYNSIGFTPRYDKMDIHKAIQNNGIFDFSQSKDRQEKWDLRNPTNSEIKKELFRVFGLDANKSYAENCKLTKTILPSESIKK